jgi:hypothetical protein
VVLKDIPLANVAFDRPIVLVAVALALEVMYYHADGGLRASMGRGQHRSRVWLVWCGRTIMRSTIAAFVLLGALAVGDPCHAQDTVGPSVAPKQAPVGHRQPRQSDVAPVQPSADLAPSAPAPSAREANPRRPDRDDEDQRLNRALNSICRGC